jgi:maltose-binding protein MalE
MNKRIAMLALAMVMAMMVALGGTSTRPLSAQSATEAPTATPTLSASVEGQLTIWADGNRSKVLTELGKEFTAKYNVPVRVQEVSDIRQNFKIAGPAGNGPDILVGAHDWIGELVANGLLKELDLGDKTKGFDAVGLKGFTYEGKLYGMPYATEAVALYYNKDLVKEAPKTWDELKKIAKDLQDSKKVENGIILMQGDAYHNQFFLTGFGGYIFGRDKDGNYNPADLGVDSEGGIAAAKEMGELVKAGLLKGGFSYDATMTAFKGGKAAFVITGPWQLADFRKAGVNYGVAKIPAIKNAARPFVGVQGFMVNAKSKNDALATAFLTEFVATKEAMQALFDADPRPSAWLEVKDATKDADIAMFGASAADGDPMPAIPAMASVWDAMGSAYTNLLQAKGDPEAVIKEAAKAIRDKIAEAK